MQFHNTICLCFLKATSSATYKGYWQIKISNQKYFFFKSTTLSGNITHSIFDHLIKFVILEDFITPKPPPESNVYNRNFFKSNKLKEDLHNIDWINEILKKTVMISMKHFLRKLKTAVKVMDK